MKNLTLQRFIMAVFLLVISQMACGSQSTRTVKQGGYSMMPNFTDGDVFTVVEVPLNELKRGDLVWVVIHETQLIKRLIGLPNETVSISDGKVFINGTELVEPYEVIPPTKTVEEIKLGSDSYFVLGDNRPNSTDSQRWGPVKGSDIKGRAVMDPKNWTLPVGVELRARNEVQDVKETQEFRCGVQDKSGA